jgi:glycosyltransferase involved in cell wall biosynthesis
MTDPGTASKDVRSVVVANPGHVPWMAHTARAAQGRGRLRFYAGPLVLTSAQVERIRALPLGPLSRLVAAELGRRSVDDDLAGSLRPTGNLGEVAAVLARRARASNAAQRRMADWRDVSFDRAVARALPSDAGSVFVAYDSALATIRRAAAHGTMSVLDYPVSHHRFAQSLLQEELRLQPSYAATMQFHEVPEPRAARLDRELRESDVIAALSEFHRSTFVEAGIPAEKVIVNNFGVDGRRFTPPDLVAEHPFRALFVGQLTQRKGLSYAVDGFERAAISGAELWLVGQPVGAEKPWLGVGGVREMPAVAPAAMPDVYRQGDVLLLPSFVEGLARVVLEAMASGLVVIATPNTGAEDLIEDGVSGWIVPIRDADAIAERLHELASKPDLRARMGQAARIVAEGRTWSAYGSRMLDVAQ